MKLVKCDNNHYYDGDSFSSCPHCSEKTVRESRGHSVAPKGPEKPQELPVSKTESRDKTNSVWTRFHKKEGLPKTESLAAKIMGEMFSRSERKEAVTVGSVSTAPPEAASCAQAPVDVEEPVAAPEAEALPVEPKPLQDEQHSEPDPHVSSSSLRSAVNAVKGTGSSEENVTVAFYHLDSSEPVVGWLVCIKGEYKGEGFALKSGKNNIGRSMKMDVALAKEPSVSRDRHAILIFEPKKRKFYIQAGEGSGLTYVNDELVMMPMEIKDFDILQLGESEFVFRSLCGEHFDWGNYI